MSEPLRILSSSPSFSLTILVLALATSPGTTADTAPGHDGAHAYAPSSSNEFPVPPPPFSSPDIFPCSECHADMEVNLERRELEDFHDDIELHHGTRERWCFDCHNPHGRDQLRLAGGELVPFTESHRLCGQCHGDKYRDWKVGVHGKRTGQWNGRKEYLLCAHCHDPHRPHFAPIEPEPAPLPPSLVRHQPRGADGHDVQQQSEKH